MNGEYTKFTKHVSNQTAFHNFVTKINSEPSITVNVTTDEK